MHSIKQNRDQQRKAIVESTNIRIARSRALVAQSMELIAKTRLRIEVIMTKFLIKLFVNVATKDSAVSQLERVLKDLPEGFKHYVHDIDASPSDQLAALDNVSITPCLVLVDLESNIQHTLAGVSEDDQVRRFCLGAIKSGGDDG